jgi:HSP20 family protein
MGAQRLPINVYEEDDRIMVAVPLPGMEPASIHLAVDGRRLTITADLRGPGQHRTKRYLVHEWTIGPSERTVDLPKPVDAARANVSFDNGVLVVILPAASRPISGEILLNKVGTAKGQTIGHVGHEAKAPR